MDRIPTEIFLHILKILWHANEDIAPLLRLNSQWFHFGISLLWQDTGIDALCKLHDDRRQIYASMVKKLHLVDPKKYPMDQMREYLEGYRHLTFPRLVHLTIALGQVGYKQLRYPYWPVVQYLQRHLHSGLKVIHLLGYFDPDVFPSLKTYCPQLQRLYIDADCQARPEALLKFLRNNATISTMHLNLGYEGSWMTVDIFNLLAEQRTLRQFSGNALVNKHILESLDNPSPFMALHYLIISVTYDTIPLLLHMVSPVRTLGLKVRLSESSDSDVPSSTIFRDIYKLTELRHLELLDYGPIAVTSNEDIRSPRPLNATETIDRFRLPGTRLYG